MNKQFPISTCKGNLELASDHIDGELQLADQSLLFRHLADCDACREQYNFWMKMREGLRNDRISVSPLMDEDFLSRLSKHQVSSRRSADRPRLTRNGLPSRYGSYAVVASIVGVLTLCSTLLLTKYPGSPIPGQKAVYSELTKEVLYLMPEVVVYSDPQLNEEL